MTRRRYELTDFEWSIIEPLLPNKSRGVARVDDRRVLNGILWRFRTGSPWADIPERYGPYTTCYNRFVRWRKARIWDRLLQAVSKAYDDDIIMIDSSCVRVHQHGATGKKGDQDDGCMGRSRGGLTTKIHALVDAEGRPIDLRLSAGQVHDSRPAGDMLDIMRADTIILANKSYDSNAIRTKAKEWGAWANIPPKQNRKASVTFSKWVYKQRNAVERFFNKIKQFRAIATRYEKNLLNFLAAIKLVAALVWIRSL
nr:IS5 family transposase [uncultured Cohaesibacter sp.]